MGVGMNEGQERMYGADKMDSKESSKERKLEICKEEGLDSDCETWTLTRDLRWRLNSFGTRSLRRILGYRWSDFVSNERLLRETQMRFVTCIVPENQLQLYCCSLS